MVRMIYSERNTRLECARVRQYITVALLLYFLLRFKDHEIILSRHVTVYADVQDAVCGELPWFMDARIKQTGHCSKNSTGRIQVSEGERLAINCTARALHDGVNGNAYL